MVVAKWDGALDLARARAILDGNAPPPRDVIEEEVVTVTYVSST
jgi:hypothetical protein